MAESARLYKAEINIGIGKPKEKYQKKENPVYHTV